MSPKANDTKLDKKKGTALAGTDVTDFERFSGFTLSPDEVRFAPRGHPLFDKRSENPPEPGMVLSLKRRGQLQEVRVRRGDGKLWVTSGHQRIINIREANRQIAAENALRGKDEQIPLLRLRVIVQDMTDDVAIEAIIASNVRIADDVGTTLEKIQQLQGFGKTPAEIAAIFGQATKEGRPKVSWVQQHLDCLRLAPAVLNHVKAGRLSVTAAAEIASLPEHAAQVAAAEKALAEGTATVREVQERVRQAKGQGPRAKPLGFKRSSAMAEAFRSYFDFDEDQAAVAGLARTLGVDRYTDDPVRAFVRGLEYASGLLDPDVAERIKGGIDRVIERVKAEAERQAAEKAREE